MVVWYSKTMISDNVRAQLFVWLEIARIRILQRRLARSDSILSKMSWRQLKELAKLHGIKSTKRTRDDYICKLKHQNSRLSIVAFEADNRSPYKALKQVSRPKVFHSDLPDGWYSPGVYAPDLTSLTRRL